MRDFSWKYFALTGDVESFMLYKEMNQSRAEESTNAIAGTDAEFAMMEFEDTSG